jgi:hypothetical protein
MGLLFFFFFLHVRTREGEGEFELVTSASLGMVHSQLNYLLEIGFLNFRGYKINYFFFFFF